MKRHNYLFTFLVTMPNGEELTFNKNIVQDAKIKDYNNLEQIKEAIKKTYEGVSNVTIIFYSYLGRFKN